MARPARMLLRPLFWVRSNPSHMATCWPPLRAHRTWLFATWFLSLTQKPDTLGFPLTSRSHPVSRLKCFYAKSPSFSPGWTALCVGLAGISDPQHVSKLLVPPLAASMSGGMALTRALGQSLRSCCSLSSLLCIRKATLI